MMVHQTERPAIEGGRPVRGRLLPYGRQTIDEEDIAAVVKVLGCDFLTTGPAVAAFEERIADYVESRYAVAFANGTAALHGALFAAEIGPQDEVITTPMTFAATANCVLYRGAIPVFVDIEPDTYNLNAFSVDQHVTRRTRAILPVHYAGQPVDLEQILETAKRHRIRVIEDAAHALGAIYHGKKIGGWGDLTVFSTHPVKPITTGEGGVVTTNDEKLYKRLRLFRTHGIVRDHADLRDQRHGAWFYEMQHLGFNYRLTDIQAALGTSQMSKLERFLARRQEIARRYTLALSGMRELTLPMQRADRTSGWHLYAVALNLSNLRVDRKRIFEALRAENIGVQVHYIPVYYHPYYQQLGYQRGVCPNAEDVYERLISLPVFPGMTDDDVADVIQALHKVLHYYSAGG